MAVGLAFAPAGVTVGEAPPPPPPDPPLAGGFAWYLASELEGSDGDRLAAWPDFLGTSARDLAQSTAADKPELKLAVQNGNNVVRFTRANTETMLSSGITLAQPVTVIAAAKVNSAAANKSIIQGTGAALYVDSSDEVWLYAGAQFNLSGVVVGTWRIFAGKFNGGSSLLSKGDGTTATGNVSTGTLDAYALGSDGGGGNSFDGDIGEVFIHPTALSDADINTAATEMKTRWNATWTNI